MDFHIGSGPHLSLDEGSSLDIGACIVDGVNLAPGSAVPDHIDLRILHSVSGFMFTCGPDQIRHPEPMIGGGDYPLHGSMAGNKAEIISTIRDSDCVEVMARIEIDLANSGHATVIRQWRMNAATGEVMLEDRLINSGKSAFPPMWMYHMNIGAHLFDDNTKLSGDMLENGEIGWRFGEGDGHVFCVPAKTTRLDEYAPDQYGYVTLGPIAAIGGKSLRVMFKTDTLPHLQMWRNELSPANVIGIEPVSHPWKTRLELEKMGLMEQLEPGEFRLYRLGFSFI